MGSAYDIIKQFPEIFKRVTLSEIDIIAKGEEPKHKHFIYVEDLDEIVEAIKTKTEKEAVEFIASKVKKRKK